MRTKTVLTLAAVAALTLAAVVPAWAHHAFSAEFDANKPVKLQGKVTKMEWVNPHAWIHIDLKGVPWMVEAGAPNALLRRGWTKESLLPGVEIIVDGYRAKDGANRANGAIITFTDGKKLFVGSSNSEAPDFDKTEKKDEKK